MTLTETATLTKRLIVIGIILSILGIIGWYGYQYYYSNYILPNQQIPEVPPAVDFGKLKAPFVPNIQNATELTYSIDTETGNVPQSSPKILDVFFIPQLGTTLLAPDRAHSLASSLQFNNGPDILSPTQYRFTNDSGGELIVDLNTGNFNFSRKIATDSSILTADVLSDTPSIVLNFKQFLATKNLMPESLTNGRSKAIYDQGSQKDSSTAIVSIWQDNIGDYPIVTPDFGNGLVKATVSKFIEEDKRYINLNYVFWPIDTTNASTYPLKTPQAALDELKTGLAFVAQKPKSNKISITSIYIAYYLSEEYSPYVQPVFVFQGPDFAGYVPAITNDFLE